jgi:hypothetical protein
MHYLMEALIVGIMMVVITIPLLICARSGGKVSLSDDLMVTFIVGYMAHVIWEHTGINKAYCTKGYACQRVYKAEINHPASL